MSEKTPSAAATTLALALLAASGPPAAAQVLAGDLLYTSVQPCRLFDTRLTQAGALAAGETRTFNVVGTTGFEAQGGRAGGCDLPGFVDGESQARAAMLNLVAVGPAGPGHLTAFPSDAGAPNASVLNYSSSVETGGLNIANGIALPLRQDVQGGDLAIQAVVSSTHVVADVVGFFTPAQPRRYYLSKTTRQGGAATTGCAEGFHMASLWEIFDPSSLVYDTTLGQTIADSGQGPPASGSVFGWIRTGAISSNSTTEGVGNCNAWGSSFSADSGTRVTLQTGWLSTPTVVSPWFPDDDTCAAGNFVWCAEDR